MNGLNQYNAGNIGPNGAANPNQSIGADVLGMYGGNKGKEISESSLGVGMGNLMSAQAVQSPQARVNSNPPQEADASLPSLSQEGEGYGGGFIQQAGASLRPLSQKQYSLSRGGIESPVQTGNLGYNPQSEEAAIIHSMPGTNSTVQSAVGFSDPVAPIADGKNKKNFTIIIATALSTLALSAFGVFGYYLFFKSVPVPPPPPPPPQEVDKTNKQGDGQSRAGETVEISKPDPQVFERTVTLENQIGEIVGSASLLIQKGELAEAEEAMVKIDGINAPRKENTEGLEKRELLLAQALSGLYTISSPKQEFQKPVSFMISFNKEIVSGAENIKLEDLRVGFIEKEISESEQREDAKEFKWYIYESSKVGESGKDISITATKIHDAYYAVISRDANEKVESLFVNKKNIVPKADFPEGSDSDADGLTDEEEKIFGTNSQLIDTDGDTYDDKAEIMGLYDPTKGGGARLLDNKFFNTYRNVEFGYSMLYPATWLVRSLDSQSTKEIIFTAPTGEFFDVLSGKNPIRLTALQWYLVQSGAESEEEVNALRAEMHEARLKNGINGAFSSDSMRVYISYKDQIFAVSYSSGSAKELYFKTTFRFVVDNFEILNFDPKEIAQTGFSTNLLSGEFGQNTVSHSNNVNGAEALDGGQISLKGGALLPGQSSSGKDDGGKVLNIGLDSKNQEAGQPAENKAPEEKISKEKFLTADDLKASGIVAQTFETSIQQASYSIAGAPVEQFKGIAAGALDISVDLEEDKNRSSSLLYQNVQSLMKILAASLNSIPVAEVETASATMGDEAVVIKIGKAPIGKSGGDIQPVKALIIRFKESVVTVQYIERIEAEAFKLAQIALTKVDVFRNQQATARASE